jgi:hypothetical protein
VSQLVLAPRRSSRVDATTHVSLRAAGVRLFATYWGSLALVDVAGHSLAASLVTLAIWSATCSIRQRPLVAAGVGVIAWCFLTGFVVNSYGDLSVHTSSDLLWLTVMTSSALAASGVTQLVRG